jgi:hypothetical protein
MVNNVPASAFGTSPDAIAVAEERIRQMFADHDMQVQVVIRGRRAQVTGMMLDFERLLGG